MTKKGPMGGRLMNLYHDTPPICIAILLQKYKGQRSLEHPQKSWVPKHGCFKHIAPWRGRITAQHWCFKHIRQQQESVTFLQRKNLPITGKLLKCCSAVFEKLHRGFSGIILGTAEIRVCPSKYRFGRFR